MVDWSGGNDRGATPKKDAIWVCAARDGAADEPVYMRNRQLAERWIRTFLQDELTAGRRVLAGFDFAFGYPAGFGQVLTGSDDPFAIWDWITDRISDAPDQNNRFDVAAQINALFPGVGPFWGNGLKRDIADLPRKGLAREGHGVPEKRMAEQQASGAFPVWQLSGAGAVGSQVLMGLPTLNRLRRNFASDLAVWPFEPLDKPLAIVEIWPSLIAKAVKATQPEGRIKDAHQVWLLAQTLSALEPDDLRAMLDVAPTPEGSILGLGHEAVLMDTAMPPLTPPPLRNDCFVMPQGAHWTAVAGAQAHLRNELRCVVGIEDLPVDQTAGRILARDVQAQRAHPPAPNAAVDGYGFAGPVPEGVQRMPLVAGRSAAGAPFDGTVPAGHAIRILTGANLPKGVDTVVLQEDVRANDAEVTFHGPLKQGANARKAGEDMAQGQTILTQGRRITPADIGMMIAAGLGRITVFRQLRVGVLSTGDELRAAGQNATDGQIYDANRPMLAAMVSKWGYEAVDLGRAPDDRAVLRGILDDAAYRCDVIIASGGASAGDEDHMSALLQGTGSLALWRIAMKPGRPLAMGLWDNTPVFGLPGNPVAAMVCALIFARPALQVLGGAAWEEPAPFLLPAAFAKSKKAGRREYLRARRDADGRVEIFPSEGSGRISGLSWATGLVELDDAAQTINPGDPVRFIPFSSFGL
ncbi:MAG: molybdenum cofactor synthesis domain-containing protein [Yoonia sp.]|uniref:molybdenum cofactor synthesis domain-containing protein n=1 Tax=Yoonia sp. TaxID=2212373 RepID=UPI003EF2E646